MGGNSYKFRRQLACTGFITPLLSEKINMLLPECQKKMSPDLRLGNQKRWMRLANNYYRSTIGNLELIAVRILT